MNFQILWPLPFVFLQCFTSVVLLNIRPSLAIIKSDPERYRGCLLSFRCGQISIGYPFWGDDRPQSCGHPDLGLSCDDTNPMLTNPMPTIVFNETNYYAIDTDKESHVLKVVRQDLHDSGICNPFLLGTNGIGTPGGIDSELFQYVNGYQNLTILYDCPFSATHLGYLNCSQGFSNAFIQTGDFYGSQECNYSATVTVANNTTLVADTNMLALQETVSEGFQLKWDLSSKACEDCRNSNGSCGYDKQFVCYCPNLPYYLS
ncbi:hypothetical protein Ddye_012150 [Dipteronia dyeriana]|uniref:non-specific serine/threonine protein kinase n=1 Tax=Dipteronia dyeriana TaxID=168575 RepID=A0AAD9X3V0_9ROSI|nr:hypothetical protein Ddye_012150 [Dipteronia dyeriana]